MGDGKVGKEILLENNVEIIISFQEERRTNVTKNKWMAFAFILRVTNGEVMA